MSLLTNYHGAGMSVCKLMVDIIRKHRSLECGNKKMIFTSGELYLYSACFVFRSHNTKVPLSNPISNYNKPEKMSLFILLCYKFCFDAEILYRIIAFCYKKLPGVNHGKTFVFVGKIEHKNVAFKQTINQSTCKTTLIIPLHQG